MPLWKSFFVLADCKLQGINLFIKGPPLWFGFHVESEFAADEALVNVTFCSGHHSGARCYAGTTTHF